MANKTDVHQVGGTHLQAFYHDRVKRQALLSNSSTNQSNSSTNSFNSSCTYSRETEVVVLSDDFCSQPGPAPALLRGPKGDPGPPGPQGEEGGPGTDNGDGTNVSSKNLQACVLTVDVRVASLNKLVYVYIASTCTLITYFAIKHQPKVLIGISINVELAREIFCHHKTSDSVCLNLCVWS